MAEEPIYLDSVFDALRKAIPARDEMLVSIGIQLAAIVADDPAEILRWLTTENPGFAGVRPIDLLKTDEGIAKLNGTLLMLGEGGTF